ncbi:hypothetical protein GOBAR_DD30117 [Gossypium barbadense]|nr:hypothetical protein GOBAR_DD30117 [Gossypium barbadense]
MKRTIIVNPGVHTPGGNRLLTKCDSNVISLCCSTNHDVIFCNGGEYFTQLTVFSSFKDAPKQLARAVPTQATFFTTYVLSSGWASLSCEIMQPFPLICNFFRKFILRTKVEPSSCALTFPHHTEIPRLLLFVHIGFTCSIMAPLILPFLLVFFFLAFLVYRNQVIALGVFGIKRSPVASGFIIPLILLTLLFNEYCRQRFSPVFKRRPAQILIEMDQQDEQLGRKEEIHNQIRSAYFQNPIISHQVSINSNLPLSRNTSHHQGDEDNLHGLKSLKPLSDIFHVEVGDDNEETSEIYIGERVSRNLDGFNMKNVTIENVLLDSRVFNYENVDVVVPRHAVYHNLNRQ